MQQPESILRFHLDDGPRLDRLGVDPDACGELPFLVSSRLTMVCSSNSESPSSSRAWVISLLNLSRSARLAKPPVLAFTTKNVSMMMPSLREKTRALRMFSPVAARAPEMVVNNPGRSHVQTFNDV